MTLRQILCRLGLHYWNSDGFYRNCTYCPRREKFIEEPHSGWSQGKWVDDQLQTVRIEFEIDESLTIFGGYRMGEDDDIPAWLHGEITKRLGEIRQLIVDGWDGEPEGTDDSARE